MRGRRDDWRRLARVVWLQHRGSAISVLVAFVALAVAIVVEAIVVHASYVGYLANGCVARPLHVPCANFTNAPANVSSMLTALTVALGIGALVSSHLTGGNMTVGTIGMAASPGGRPLGSWLVRSWFTGPNGKLLGTRAAYAVLGKAMANKPNVVAWLSLHHFTYWVSYQPASRFWIFQGVEGVVLLVLALACGTATLWTLRIRGRS